MNVSHPHDFVFLAVPFTECEPVFNALQRHYGLSGPLEDGGEISYERGIPKDVHNYHSIACYINPYKRMVNFWLEIKNKPEKAAHILRKSINKSEKKATAWKALVKKAADPSISFTGFVQFFFSDSVYSSILTTQNRHLYPYGAQYYVSYENRDKCFRTLPCVSRTEERYYNEPIALQPNTDTWKTHYTDKAKRLVKDHWLRDFEQYGYAANLEAA